MTPPTAAPPTVPKVLPPVSAAPPTPPIAAPTTVSLSRADIPEHPPRGSNNAAAIALAKAFCAVFMISPSRLYKPCKCIRHVRYLTPLGTASDCTAIPRQPACHKPEEKKNQGLK